MNHQENPRSALYIAIVFAILVLSLVRWKILRDRQQPICKDCNVILIVLDTLRADRLPCYGYQKATMRNLCAFADQSILFENHYVTASHSLPSQTSIFTSLLPSQHGMITMLKDELPGNIRTLAQILQQRDYSTFWHAPLDNPQLPVDRGLDRGFEEFVAEDAYRPFETWRKTIDRSLSKRGKSFLFLHTYKIHDYAPLKEASIKRFVGESQNEFVMTRAELDERINSHLLEEATRIKEIVDKDFLEEDREIWNNPQEDIREFRGLVEGYIHKNEDNEMGYQVRSIVDEIREKARWKDFQIQNRKDLTPEQLDLASRLYDALAYELDNEVQELLEYLERKELLKNSIIVVLSDHGDGFDEHGEGLGHGISLYQTLIHTPLIIHFPGNKPKRISQNVSSIDIFPTILEAVGIEIPEQAEGISLTPLIMGREWSYQQRPIISERMGEEFWQNESIIVGDWKLVNNFEKEKEAIVFQELYNIRTDPQEQNNLANQKLEITKRLQNALKEHKKQRKKFEVRSRSFPIWFDEERRKRLIETGYF